MKDIWKQIGNLTISIDKGTYSTYLFVNVFITDYKLTSDETLLTSLDTLLSKYTFTISDSFSSSCVMSWIFNSNLCFLSSCDSQLLILNNIKQSNLLSVLGWAIHFPKIAFQHFRLWLFEALLREQHNQVEYLFAHMTHKLTVYNF